MKEELKEKKIVLFGAGKRGQILLEKLIRYGVMPAYFVDNSQKEHIIEYFEGGILEQSFPVFTPDVLLDEDKTHLGIIITPSSRYYSEIEFQVKKMGLANCVIAMPTNGEDFHWTYISLLCELVITQRKQLEERKTFDAWERKLCINRGFGDYINAVGFEDKYFNFVSGLNEESVCIVNRIIDRIHRLINSDGKAGYYTTSEQKYFKELNENFFQNIFKVSETLYRYKNYSLPCRGFNSDVFYGDYFFAHIHNIEAIRSRDIVDAGAYIGDTAILLSQYTDKKVYAFEPMGQNYELLQKTIKLNKLGNVVTQKCGLGARKAEFVININTDGNGSDSSYNNDELAGYDKTEITNVTTIDEFVNENILDIGLIKADIEGFETEMLMGAIDTIKKQKPVLAICIYHSPQDFFEIKPLIESWNLGYTFSVYKPIDRAVSETMLIAEVIDK